MPDLTTLISLLQLAVKDRTQLALENIALRHQLAVYKRSVQRLRIEDRDRIFWLSVMRMLREWRGPLFGRRLSRSLPRFGRNCMISVSHSCQGQLVFA